MMGFCRRSGCLFGLNFGVRWKWSQPQILFFQPHFKKCPSLSRKIKDTLQGTNISHLGKRKIIFKMPFLGDMLIPWRVYLEFASEFRKRDTHFLGVLTQVRNRWLCFHPIRMLGRTWIFFFPFWGATWEAFFEDITQKSLREENPGWNAKEETYGVLLAIDIFDISGKPCYYPGALWKLACCIRNMTSVGVIGVSLGTPPWAGQDFEKCSLPQQFSEVTPLTYNNGCCHWNIHMKSNNLY